MIIPITQQTSDIHMSVPPVPTISVLENVVEPVVGAYVGQVKWFNDKLGFGFITVTSAGPNRGNDYFVHFSGIKPINSKYLTLKKGEYVNLNIIEGAKGQQAVDVTGVGGGSLMCDVMCTSLPPGAHSGPTHGITIHGISETMDISGNIGYVMPPPPVYRKFQKPRPHYPPPVHIPAIGGMYQQPTFPGFVAGYAPYPGTTKPRKYRGNPSWQPPAADVS